MYQIGSYRNALVASYTWPKLSTDYYPFGSALPTRSWSDASRVYRYGFNGKEKDSETANDDYDFGARTYDARLGRWLSLDPLIKKYHKLSPYNFVANNPIIFIDKDGRDLVLVGNEDQAKKTIKILNSGLGSELVTCEYDAVNGGYQVKLKKLNDEELNKLTEEQKVAYSSVKDVIGEIEVANDNKISTTFIVLNDNDGRFTFGDYATSNIDLQQIEAVGNVNSNCGVVSSFTVLMHELNEQKEHQVTYQGKDNYPRDHYNGGFPMEEKLTGYNPQEATGEIIRYPPKIGKISGILHLSYVKKIETYDEVKKETTILTQTIFFDAKIENGKITSFTNQGQQDTIEIKPDEKK